MLPLPVPRTSLVVIAMKSTAGFAGYVAGTAVDWPLALGVVVAASLGAVVAGRRSDRIDAHRLRAGFGWFVLAVGQLVLVSEVPAVARPWTVAGALALSAGVITYVRRSVPAGTQTAGTTPATGPSDGARPPDPDADPDRATPTIQRSSL